MLLMFLLRTSAHNAPDVTTTSAHNAPDVPTTSAHEPLGQTSCYVPLFGWIGVRVSSTPSAVVNVAHNYDLLILLQLVHVLVWTYMHCV